MPSTDSSEQISQYQVLSRNDESGDFKANDDFALSILHGLSETPKQLSSRYLYDDRGSKLFQEIMDLPEYYLTRSEFQIFDQQGPAIAKALQSEALDLVDLGSGDGAKTVLLLRAFLQAKIDLKYVPVDISEQAMKDLVSRLKTDLPGLWCEGLVGDYFHGLNRLGRSSTRRKLVLFLGSNIGNYTPKESRHFLRSLWYSLNDGDYLLLGVDLRKNIKKMQDAYLDSGGVTAQFNLNLLRRINREFGADFDLDQFEFEAVFNIRKSAVESFLTSKIDQQVTIPKIHQNFQFLAGEAIKTESSYKYRLSDLESLASDCDFRIEANYFDEDRNFVDSLWQVQKPS